ncbi:hypothetical protein M514_25420 [Trichuris suis]|uniref:GIY-YIG domain-containing protein n=1 Tax=Trichuris suis TaxID=68888 RepID=A0A085MYW6_9BILA|nr:hypothetical protein M514_25420 [Trichuris suis]
MPPRRTGGPLVTLPYCTGLGELLKRLGRSLDFRAYFKSSALLSSILRNGKIKVPYDERPDAAYQIKCGCNASYIGETRNSLLHRYNQHLDGLNRYNNARRKTSVERKRAPKFHRRKTNHCQPTYSNAEAVADRQRTNAR